MSDDKQLLLDILGCIDRIEEYTAEGREQFARDRRTQDAVIRNLEIIGEATKNLSDEVRDHHRDVPWKRIAGMRDRLIHGYPGVSLTIVWGVVVDALRPSRRQFSQRSRKWRSRERAPRPVAALVLAPSFPTRVM